jgi:hypothetical protein
MASGCARGHRPAGLPRGGVHQPAAAGRGHGGVPQAEKGATPNALLHNLKHNKVLHEQNLFVSVQHHEVPWIGFDKRCELESAGPRLLAGHAALRLQERARRARGAEAAGRPRHRARRHGDQLLPQPRHRHPDARWRHGAVAREAVRQHAPQRQRGGRLPAACRPTASSSWAPRSRSDARSFWRDLSLPAVVAGFVAVLVGYTSSVVIIFQAARRWAPRRRRRPRGCGRWAWAWA